MKTTLHRILTASLILCAPALNAEPADPPNPAPLVQAPGRLRQPMPRIAAKPRPFLGIATSPVPPVLASQLNLPEGFGLVVEEIVPDSPAATAGVQKNDVLKLFNDQQLTEPGQLAKLVQAAGRDTEVTLTVMRKGQEQKLRVKISETTRPEQRGLPQIEEWARRFGRDLDSARGELPPLDDMRRGIEEKLRAVTEEAKRAEEKIRDMVRRAEEGAKRLEEPRRTPDAETPATPVRPRLRRDPQRGDESRNENFSTHVTAKMVMKDESGEIQITETDGHRVLVAKDPKGVETFNGPIDTEEQMKALPDELRKKVESMKVRTEVKKSGSSSTSATGTVY
jgi:hypothetical protein